MELKSEAVQRQMLGTNVGHRVMSVLADAEFRPFLQSLKLPAGRAA